MNGQPIEKAIREAGALLKKGYFEIQYYGEKERGHIHSEYDLKVDQFLMGFLRKNYPHDSIYSEESTQVQGSSDRRWIIDPIDGTAYFVFGEPYFSISVAKEVDGIIVESHVYNPLTGEYYHSDGESSFLNGDKITVSETSAIEDSFFTFGFSADIKNIKRYHQEWGYYMDNCLKGLAWICPALSICNVARGRIEGFFDFGCSFEGQAGASLILKCAGGSMVNYDGSAFDPKVKGGIFTNGHIILSLPEESQ